MKAVIALVALVVAAPGAAHAQKQVEKEGGFLIERDTVDIQPQDKIKVQAIAVDNRLGDVTVVGHDAPGVSLTVVKRAPDGEILDRLKVNLVTDPDGTITLGTSLLPGQEARPLPAKSVRIDISLEVPRNVKVQVKAWNGKVSVAGVRAGASLEAHAGDITVTDVNGQVSAETSAGSQTLKGVRGEVKVESVDGGLALDGISGENLAASTHDAPIVATRVKSKNVRIRTTFGTIHFSGEVLAGGAVELASYKGNVDVQLVPSKGLALKLDAYARDGQVDSRLEMTDRIEPEKGRLMGTFGPARARPAILRVQSLVGDVRIGLAGE